MVRKMFVDSGRVNMRLVSVFDYNDLSTTFMRDIVCDGQGNDSFRKVYLNDGEWMYGKPLDTIARVAQWAKDHRAHTEEGAQNPYVLFSVSW